MKIHIKWKDWSRKGKLLVLILLIAIFLAAAGIVIYFVVQKNQTPDADGRSQTLENGMVSATGTTATASLTEEINIDSLDTTLYVEDIYISSGQSVEAGEKVLKISDDSIKEARKELEQKAKEAEIAYKQQLITFEESKLEAKRDADTTAVEGNYADAEYEYQLQQASQTLSDLEEQVSDVQDLVAEYTDAIDNNYYYTYYQVKELQDECSENFTLLMKLYEEWGISSIKTGGSSGSTVSAENSMSNSESGSQNGMSGTAGASSIGNSNIYSSIYNDFDGEVSEEIKERDEAASNYETALAKAQYSIEEAKAQYELLNAQLQEEYVNFEKSKVTLQADCDTTKAQAELAQTSYETEVKKLQEELDTISDANDTAQENLENFESSIGDGYLYTESAGTIMRVNARKESSISVDMPIVEYSDTEKVTVSVSVDQSDIANVEVGATAAVTISELGRYEGTVTSISPVSQSDSRSSVYYTVTVTLTGDLSELSSNLTATVMIGGDNSEKENTAGTTADKESAETEETRQKADPEKFTTEPAAQMEQ